MKNAGIFITTISILAVMAGCAGTYELIKAAGSGTRQDVFQEILPGNAPLSGYAGLRIHSSLKTHKAGIYSGKDLHGTAAYKMVINIDGQTIELSSTPQMEHGEATGEVRNSEAGEGVRYRFSKNISIKAGTHKIIIAIPIDGYAMEREITLKEGSENSLNLVPVYGTTVGKKRYGYFGETSFKEGIKGFKIVMNGHVI